MLHSKRTVNKSEVIDSMYQDANSHPHESEEKPKDSNPHDNSSSEINKLSDVSQKTGMRRKSTKPVTDLSYYAGERVPKKSVAISIPGRRIGISLKDMMNEGNTNSSKKKMSKSHTIRPTLKVSAFDKDKPTNNTCKEKFKNFVEKYLDHNVELGIMTFVTLFALFGPDFKALGLSPIYDPVFNIIFFIVMFMFFSELLASVWVKQGYYKSFFYWLDLFACISMILEIEWILFPIVKLLISWSIEDADSKVFLLESRMDHKLTMTIRVLRIIRLIRIVKLYKVFVVIYTKMEKKKKFQKYLKRKQEKEKIQKKKEEDRRRKEEEKRKVEEEAKRTRLTKNKTMRRINTISNAKAREIDITPGEVGMARETIIGDTSMMARPTIMGMLDNSTLPLHFQDPAFALLQVQKRNEEEEKMLEMNVESNISKAASESITQKVIFLILLMLFIAPITDDDVYISDANLSYLILCRFINNYWTVYGGIGLEQNTTINKYITEGADPYFPIIEITYNNTQIWYNQSITDDTSHYREDEIGYAFSPEGYTQVVFSNKTITTTSAAINIFRTIFVIFILSYMAIILERDVQGYVLKPLEAMIDLVDSVAKDPINMKNIENLKNKLNKSSNKNEPKRFGKKDSAKGSSTNVLGVNNQVEVEGAEYEMKVIQMAIIKISALLAIGFGEAGGEILRENISSQEGLNPMIAGKKKCAIFGFCDIRHFADINVALQEKTMVFVNEIADIVHSCVDKFGGSANKNIGEAFLIVWKFPHLENLEDDVDPIATLHSSEAKLNSHVADQAVLGYLNIIKKINKSQTILSYKNNSEIRAKFGDKFKVQMGFGLHVGWGIEGPIGSFYKIDCSYLSPNVNISARLEAATRQYGVSILISGELYDLLSTELKNIFRIIDIVTVKGSLTPLRLYTVYINHNLRPGKLKNKMMTMKAKRKYYMDKKERMKNDITNSKTGSVGKLVLNKKGFKEMLTDKKRPLLFYDKFHEGFKHYIDGQWDKAYYKFKDALFLDSTDGPTKTLFNYIKNRNKTAPSNWNGCRELTSK